MPGKAILLAFDLLMIRGEDIRCRPIEERRAALARVLKHNPHGIMLSEPFQAEGQRCFARPANSASKAS